MRGLRLVILGCLLCGALALPAVALAGGSAGCRKHTDPDGSSPTCTGLVVPIASGLSATTPAAGALLRHRVAGRR